MSLKTLVDRVLVFVNRKLCKHRNTLRKITSDRIYLACMDCPWESPGFRINDKAA
jgi:hypothetical protein